MQSERATTPTTTGPVRLRRVPYDAAGWAAEVATIGHAEVFHGAEWLGYLTRTQGAEPVLAEVLADDRRIGWFVGATVRRFGARILGSPMPGWGTEVMSFLLEDDARLLDAAAALPAFAFDALRCVHLELAHRSLPAEPMERLGYVVERGGSFQVDLARTEAELLSGVNATSRNLIRRATRDGLRCTEETGDAFIAEYYRQLEDVFAHQGLPPTYPIERVHALMEALGPTGQVLGLAVRSADGEPLSSCITLGRNQMAVLWGAAFWRSRAALHPNELMHWEAIRRWRERGVAIYDFGGRGDYKAKYGGRPIETYRYQRSRWPIMAAGRDLARKGFAMRQQVRGRRLRQATTSTTPPDATTSTTSTTQQGR